jgi:protein-S-isoprenylcysteine O-methyltransferase Ste14
MGGFYGHVRHPPVLRATLMIVISLALTNLITLLLGNLIVWIGLLEPLADALT